MNQNVPEDDQIPSEPLNRFEERRRRREERRAARAAGGGNAWIAGAVLIIIGVLIMLQNLGAFSLENWWALFIMIPALGAFANAWRSYQDAGGRLNAPARGSLIGGLVLTMVTAIFLFSLSWGILGPILLIVLGAGMLLNFMLPG